ncbi:hypothetical protein H0W91_01905 [Patescibacteria group bacterium]|nr:hypothetical protein [Patescibacteria group bacterium]
MKKYLGILAISFSLLFIAPQTTHAQYVDVVQSVISFAGNFIAKAVAQKMVEKLTAETVNWINSGFQGNPAYVTDPGQFFLDSADNIASHVLSGTDLNKLCSPFKAQVRLALVKNYLSDNENYSCSLSTIKNNYDQFTRDFSAGGWQGWLEVTQNDQNNPYGSYLEAKQSLSIKIGTEQQNKQKQLEQGNGFLSFEKCSAAGVITQKDIDDNERLIEIGNLKRENNALAGKKAGDCVKGAKTVETPGSVIAGQLDKALPAGLQGLVNAHEIQDLIGALIGQLMNKAIGGLRGLSSPSTSAGKSYTDQLRDNPQRQVDPNGGRFTGGQTSCTSGPGSRDADGNTTPGEVTCTTSPIVVKTPVCTTDASGNDSCTTDNVKLGGGNDPGVPAPSDAGTKHGNHQADVQKAKDSMIADGYTFKKGVAECQASTPFVNNRLELLKRSIKLIGDDNGIAGLLSKTGGNNCSGFASDIIAFPDGYIYDAINGTAEDEQGAGWSPSGCGTDGTCSDRYVGDGVVTHNSGGGTRTITGTIDPSTVRIVNAVADVTSWPETTQISGIDFSGDWRFDFSKKDGVGRWPDQFGGPGIAASDTIQYTVWLFLKINGQWVGSGFIQMRHDRAQAGGTGPTLFDQLPRNWYYGTAWSPMTPAVRLKSGDQIGFMVTSGNSRNGGVPKFKERSNIVLVTLSGTGGSFTQTPTPTAPNPINVQFVNDLNQFKLTLVGMNLLPGNDLLKAGVSAALITQFSQKLDIYKNTSSNQPVKDLIDSIQKNLNTLKLYILGGATSDSLKNITEATKLILINQISALVDKVNSL